VAGEISVTLLGIPEFNAALTVRADNVRNATRVATHRAGLLLERRTKQKLTTYSHRRGTPTPSPPGHPPAIISGQLRRGIKTEGSAFEGDVITVRVGPTAVYGRIQELGGRCGRNLATTLPARPYLGPTLRAIKDSGELQAEFVAAWRKSWSSKTGQVFA
jgi:phage gpG-like protein